MKNYYLTLILLFSCFSLALGQTTIYAENFSGQNGKGAIGPAPSVNLSGVNWTVDVSAATLVDDNDYFIVDDEALRGRDLDGSGIWLSPIIDITGFTNVQFSLDALEGPDPTQDNLENADTYITEYRIDAGPWTTAAINGNLLNDFTAVIVSDNNLNGNTIQLRVIMTNNGGGENHFLDNIVIEGTASVNPTIVTNPNLLTGLEYVEGETSIAEHNFTVQGFNLTADIVLNAPASYEISTTSGAGFGNTVTLTQTGGTVNLTTIYVKLISGLTSNFYNEVITATSTGIVAQNVNINGEVTTPIADCSELIISEYHEAANGTPNEKFVELYNPTNTIIDLTNYRLALYPNGRALPIILNLTGIINPYDTYLLSKDASTLCVSGEADICTTSNVLNFSGNDALALQTIGGENIDVLGIIGNAVNFAQNVNLRRNVDIAIPTVTYDPSQWSSLASNDTSNLGVHISDCQCSITTTWDGTAWDNGLPSINTAVVIDSDFDTSIGGLQTSFSACSLIVNAGNLLIIEDGTFIEVQNDIIANGGITVFPQGSVVQIDDLATTTANGNIIVQKETSLLNSSFEYTYWSSPVVGETIENTFVNVPASRRFLFNAANFEDLLIEVNNTNTFVAGQDDIDDDGNAWQAASGVMGQGVGYATTAAPAGVFPSQQQFTFEGAFNNGVITPAISNVSGGAYRDWNFIGNPYPSAIDATTFFTVNAGIVDHLFLWSQSTPLNANASGSGSENFSNNDYAIISASGISTAGASGIVPNGFIASGQGFFVEALAGTNVTFNNSMRVTGDNNQFFRSPTNTITTNREVLWLNLTSDNGVFNQIAVAHIDGATDSNDGSFYDIKRNASLENFAKLYSTIDNSTDEFVIQGKAISSLDINEVIRLGFNTVIDVPTTYTISIAQFEGAFYTANTVYLKDNLLGLVHNLSNSNYNFISEVGMFNNRFEIVFNNNILAIDDIQVDSNELTLVELPNGDVEVKITNGLTITNVEILDMLGRRVYKLSGNNATEVYNLSKLSKAAYIARVTLSNGQVISKKAIKQK